MKLLTQENIIVNQLKANGFISRNWCLANFISRLGAITNKMEKKGWVFNPHYIKTEKGKDYVYELESEPPLNKYQEFNLRVQQGLYDQDLQKM